MTIWHIIAVLTPALGALAVVYGLRFFPITKAPDDQYEMDLDVPTILPVRRRSSMAHDIDRTTDMVKEEIARIKKSPRPRM